MKLKKLFAGIVAVAMMATMAMPSFAAGTTAATKNTTSAVDNAGQVTIALNYTGTGFKTDPTGVTFDNGGAAYDLKNTSLTGQQYTDAKALTISADAFEAKENATDNKLTIQLPRYTNVGTYYYSFTQSVSTTDGMTHDDTKMYLMVHVINEDGEDLSKTGLKCMVAILNADPTNTATNLTNSKIDSLTNVYKSKDMEVEKVVKGDLGDRNQEFNFKVVLTKTKAVTGDITFKAPHESEEIKITSTDWDANNTYTTKVFMMKHGESATFANLPEGVTIKAYEVDDKGESVGNSFGSYDVTGNETEVTVSTSSATKITITNKSNEHVDTGVILDNAPYIALLTIVAAGAVLMVIKKRRNYED